MCSRVSDGTLFAIEQKQSINEYLSNISSTSIDMQRIDRRQKQKKTTHLIRLTCLRTLVVLFLQRQHDNGARCTTSETTVQKRKSNAREIDRIDCNMYRRKDSNSICFLRWIYRLGVLVYFQCELEVIYYHW